MERICFYFEVVFGDLLKGVILNNVIGYVIGIVLDVDDIFKFIIWVIDEYGKYVDVIFKMEIVGMWMLKFYLCL